MNTNRLSVAVVQKLVTGNDDSHDRYWLYWTGRKWSRDIQDAKTWTRQTIRFADAVANKHMGAVVSMHEV